MSGPPGSSRRARSAAAWMVVAAALFGAAFPLSKPLVPPGELFPLGLAAVFYLAAGAVTAAMALGGPRGRETSLARRDIAPLAAAIFLGAVAAPIAHLCGLQRAPAHLSAIMSSSEALFTALLAVLFFREAVKRADAAWIVVLLAGAGLVAWSAADPTEGTRPVLGLALIAASALLWSADNNFSRLVSGRDPLQIAAWKGLVGGGALAVAALAFGMRFPTGLDLVQASLIGVACYGGSIVLFVIGLRHLGAAKTAAYFAMAPGFGVLFSWIVLGEVPGLMALGGGALMLLGALGLIPGARPAPSPSPKSLPAADLDLSILVLTLDAKDETLECLESIAKTVTRSHEVLVLDNGSIDGTAEEVARKFPSARVVRSDVNLGYARAMNRLAGLSRGRSLLQLNNDARLEPGAADALIAHLEANPGVAAVGPALVRPDGRLQHSFDNAPTPWSVLLNKSLLRMLAPSWYPSKYAAPESPVAVESLIGAAMMVRREAWERVGPFDERFFAYLEETDWCVRARAAGYEVRYVPSARVVHKQGATKATFGRRGALEYANSLIEYLRRHHPEEFPLFPGLYAARALLSFQWARFAFLVAGRPVSWTIRGAVRGLAPVGDWLVRPDEPGLRAIAERWPEAASRARVVKDLRVKRMLDVDGYRIRVLRKPGRAFHELWVSQETARRGVACVPIAGACERGGESIVAVRWLDGWERVDRASNVSARAYGAWCRGVHAAGVRQYDFNPTNALTDGREFRLIDYERVEFGDVDDGEAVESLARMARVGGLPRAERLRFLLGYLGDRAGEWKAWWRAIASEFESRRPEWESRMRRLLRGESRNVGEVSRGTVRVRYRKADPETGRGGWTRERAEAALGNGASADGAAGAARREWEERQLRAWLEGGRAPVAVVWDEATGRGRVIEE